MTTSSNHGDYKTTTQDCYVPYTQVGPRQEGERQMLLRQQLSAAIASQLQEDVEEEAWEPPMMESTMHHDYTSSYGTMIIEYSSVILTACGSYSKNCTIIMSITCCKKRGMPVKLNRIILLLVSRRV